MKWTLDEAAELIKGLKPTANKMGYQISLLFDDIPNGIALAFMPTGDDPDNPDHLVKWLEELWGAGEDIWDAPDVYANTLAFYRKGQDEDDRIEVWIVDPFEEKTESLYHALTSLTNDELDKLVKRLEGAKNGQGGTGQANQATEDGGQAVRRRREVTRETEDGDDNLAAGPYFTDFPIGYDPWA